jgi:hypothetical protein
MVLRQALEIFYFWVNFAPLTRGTAACGYAALLSVMLSRGWMFAEGWCRGDRLPLKTDIITPSPTGHLMHSTSNVTSFRQPPHHIPGLLPKDKQLDWEAILADSFETFLEQVLPWFQAPGMMIPSDVVDTTDPVATTFTTLRYINTSEV